MSRWWPGSRHELRGYWLSEVLAESQTDSAHRAGPGRAAGSVRAFQARGLVPGWGEEGPSSGRFQPSRGEEEEASGSRVPGRVTVGSYTCLRGPRRNGGRGHGRSGLRAESLGWVTCPSMAGTVLQRPQARRRERTGHGMLSGFGGPLESGPCGHLPLGESTAGGQGDGL